MSKKRPRRPDTSPEPKPNQAESGRLQDEQGARQKSSGHKKVTADKWNQ